MVAHLPLTAESAKKFDADKALEFFKTVEGLPYGYHNFIYGWIDTPDGDWPPLLPREIVPVAMSLIEKIAPATSAKLFTLGLNKRMNTTDKTIPQLAALAAEQHMEVEDVMAMPEHDGWVYPDGLSYVCSAFTTAMYKASGMFGDMDINATEFQPRDAY